MPNDARSRRKIEDNESNSSKNKLVNRGSTSSASGKTDRSLRSSVQETSSKQMVTSPSRTRKSGRLEKRTPPTPPVQKKSGRFEQQNTPSPLRRSDRGKAGQLGREAIQSSIKKKEKREKSVTELTVESENASTSKKSAAASFGLKRKRMDGRAYKSLFKNQRKRDTLTEIDEKLERPKKSPRVDSTASNERDHKLIKDIEDGGDECQGGLVEESKDHPDAGYSVRSVSSPEASDALENGAEEELSYSSRRCCSTGEPAALRAEDDFNISKSSCTVEEISDDAELVREGCSVAKENLQIPQLVGCTSTGGDVILRSAEQGIRKLSEMHTDTKGAPASVEVSPISSIVDLGNHGFGGTCASCSRRIRLDHGSQKEELCSCAGMSNRSFISSLKDRAGVEAPVPLGSGEGCSTQLNEALPDSQGSSSPKVCSICKLGGEIMICNGGCCNRYYHLSCLDPLLDDVPPRAWHCIWCIKKKIEFGVHSVTKGVESIWDVREVEVAGAKGMRRQKQYLVKYQGLAHAHNHWVSETQLLIDAPCLVANYNHKNQDVRWNSEWTLPQRLLKKKLLVFSKLHGDCDGMDAGDKQNCQFEWLVKWKGLDYEYATWELENASFLKSQHGERLIKDFNVRHENPKIPVDKNQKGPSIKLSKLFAGGSLVTDTNLLNNVNRLRECWVKCQNTAVFDDQERIMTVVLFILSLSNVCRPFLIITTSNSLSQWEAEFTRWAPDTDVVAYSGSRDSRRRIRTLEFYDEGGSVMLQVLLSSLEVAIEDVETLSSLKWEVIIIDECRNSTVSSHLEQIKMFASGVRVLLFNGQIKDTPSEYLHILSMLESKVGSDKICGLKSECNVNLGKLKEKLSRFTAYSSKSDTTKFVEYWLPVQISNLQLEQYCSALLSSSYALRSKSDPHGALHDILLTLRKCCDHPYILDWSLQPFHQGFSAVEMLEIGIKASGKLQLLDKVLSETKLRQLRVLIIFQSIVGCGASIGDILDDYLRQRFGENSYERVETCVNPSKRQAALNRFNNKDSGRFVFLLENRVCHSSIKLSFVDTVIIYDSDINPGNDLRLLQRISLDSQSKQTKIFRLYSCYTVEERALVLAKQDGNLDNSLQSISRSPNHTLMWGASYLFSRLDEYHAADASTSAVDNSSGHLLLNDVIKEFSAIISESCDYKGACSSFISKVQPSMGTYIASFPLLGEQKLQLTSGEEPHIFWRKLLDGRNPKWRCISARTPRGRKRAPFFDGLSHAPENGSDESAKRRKKLANHGVDAISTQPSIERCEVAASKGARENDGINGEHASRSPSRLLGEVDQIQPEERRMLYKEQKSLHIHLKSEIAKLFGVINVSEDIKHMVGRFLEYVMENHRVSRESETIIQAFQISLCWIAASILKQKTDKEDIFFLAKQHLQFECSVEEANNVYLKLRSLKKMFLQRLDQDDNASSSRCSVSAVRSVAEEPSNGSMSQGVASTMLQVKTEIKESLQDKEFSGEGIEGPIEKLMNSQMEKAFKYVQYKCDRGISNLAKKQQAEIEEFLRIWEKKKKELEEEYRLELAVLRSIHGQSAATKDRQKALETKFARKMQEHRCVKDQHLKELEVKFSALRNEEMQKVTSWLAGEKSSHSDHSDELRLLISDSGDDMGCSQENLNVFDNIHKTVAPVCEQHVELQSPDEQADMTSIEEALVATFVQSDEVGNSGGGSEDNFCVVPLPPEEHADGVISDKQIRDCSGISESAPEEVAGHNHTSEATNIIEELGTENSLQENSSYLQNDAENPLVVVCSIDRHQNSPEELSVELPCIAEVPSSDDASSLPQNPVNLDECSQPSGDNGTHSDEMPLGENQDGIQTEAEAGGTIKNTCEALLADGCEQQQAIAHTPIGENGTGDNETHTDEMPLGENQVGIQTEAEAGGTINNTCEAMLADGCEQHQPAHTLIAAYHSQREVAPQTNDDAGNSIQIPESSPLLDGETAEPLHLAVTPAEENSEPCASDVVLDITLTRSQPKLPAVSRVDPQPITDLCASSQNTETPFQVVQDSGDLPSQAVFQPNTTVAFFQGSSNMQVHPAHQMGTLNSALPFHVDPLHREWERINKEKEHATKGHEDMKSNLRSECEKEIEDIIAQIRKKYDLKLQEAEAAYLLKRNELDFNQNKVLMNKVLADAFRCKCMDLKPSGFPSVQQVVPSSYMQHLHQVSLQHSLRSSPVTGLSLVSQQALTTASLRSSPISGLSSNDQPVAALQTSVPSLPVANRSVHSGGVSQPTFRSAPVAGLSSSCQPAANQQTAAVSRSTGVSMGIPSRPPLISAITPSTGNIRLGGEIRAPAPHLQPFRAPTSAPVSSPSTLPNGLQSHLRPSNVAASSSSLPQLASIQSTPLPSQRLQYQIQPPNLPTVPVNLSGSRESSLVHDIGGLPAFQNPSLSAQELLSDMVNRSQANRPGIMPPLPDICSNFDSLDLCDFQTLGSVQGGSTSTGTATNVMDVVCLSDDD